MIMDEATRAGLREGAERAIIDPRVQIDKLHAEGRRWTWAISLLLIVVGGAALWWAFDDAAPLRGVLGALLATVGLRTFNGLVRSQWLDREWTAELRRQRSSGAVVEERAQPARIAPPTFHKQVVVGGIGLGLLGSGLIAVGLAGLTKSWEIALFGVLLGALSTGPFSLLLAYWREGARFVPPGPGDQIAWRPADVAARWALAGMVGCALAGFSLGSGWFSSFEWSVPVALATLFVGLLAYQVGLPGVCDAHASRAGEPAREIGSRMGRTYRGLTARFPGDCTGDAGWGAALGSAAVVLGLWWGVGLVWVPGAILLVLSVMAVGVGFKRRDGRLRRELAADRTGFARPDTWFGWWFALGVAGLLLVAAVLQQVWASDLLSGSVPAALAIAVLIMLVGASLVWQGEGVFFGVLLGAAIVFASLSSTAPDPGSVSGTATPPQDRANARLVVFGDSFISGEGVERFFEGTDDRSNHCRRATTAYAVLVAEQMYDGSLDFYACSGAVMDDVIDLGGAPDERACVDEAGNRFAGQMPCSPATVYGRRRQIDNVAESGTPELVLVSIGGNDSGFGDIVKGCLLPGSCVERREDWLEFIATLGPDLEQTYTEIREAFEPGTPIVVMPYPLILGEKTCNGSPLRAEEHRFIVELTAVLDEQIKRSAQRAGVLYFEPGITAFEGHRLCESSPDERAINLVEFQASSGGLADQLDTGGWLNNSMHPNRLGHELTSEALVAWLVDGDNLAMPEVGPDAGDDSSDRVEVRGVRPVRPYLVEIDEQFTSALPASAVEQIDGFATQSFVFDDPEKSLDAAGNEPDESTANELLEDGALLAERWWRVPITGASTIGPVLYTDPRPADDGRLMWHERAVITEDRDLADPDLRVYADEGELILMGQIPEDPPADYVQWVLFQTTDTTEAAPDWELRAIRYCGTDDLCERSFDDWMSKQAGIAIATAAPPVLFIVAGGYLFALGWTLAIWPWLQRRLAALLATGVGDGSA